MQHQIKYPISKFSELYNPLYLYQPLKLNEFCITRILEDPLACPRPASRSGKSFSTTTMQALNPRLINLFLLITFNRTIHILYHSSDLVSTVYLLYKSMFRPQLLRGLHYVIPLFIVKAINVFIVKAPAMST